MAIEIRSSAFTQPAVTIRPEKGLLSIRAYDKSRPGSAVCVVIPHQELLALVAQVHRLTHAPDSVEQLPEIDDVAKGFGLTPVESNEWDTVKEELNDERRE